ncbi:TPA: HlyD family efflux transporter periplasmic adaptor subunit [Bacillus cereus]|uniref:HlyD family secretion protein n=1 Tax=Bacillus cereus group TaxID=86661 RepID=UPI000241E47E|nr:MULTISPECIES: HlyD family efflux transporter periplasmic adaptor subunit [Bacillus cereus group]AEW58252.1 HlyD family secretion protein [Bacillus cereus F837/76]AJH69460.1 hlyD secretion family protein [Bacillus thuringiensis]KXY96765.1 hemolysin D [Bacillus cereus]MDA2015778.1 HlyD family efflux transporter periplasmic adaptor subunit [Bacillus cereus]PYD98507.1 biotin/lipoyl-binding protein [Bacillus cereus]
MSKMYSFEELTDSVELLEKKPPKFILLSLLVLFIFLIGFSIWALFGKVDIVSKGNASIQNKEDLIIYKSQINGVVSSVFVKSGDTVKKGDILIQLENQDLSNKKNELEAALKNFEMNKSMLEQLKNSIKLNQDSFMDDIDKKFLEEYKAYEDGYKSLKLEKEDISSIEAYKSNAIVSINQRIQAIDQEHFIKKQELDSINKQSELLKIQANKDGVVQFSSAIQKGDLIDANEELVALIPEIDKKKVKIYLSAQEIKGIRKGNQVQYAFNLKGADKQLGKITYISKYPIFDKNTKEYVYELDATINIKDTNELYTGMIGKAAVITGESSVWEFILRKLDFI